MAWGSAERSRLCKLLRSRSVRLGDVVLASGRVSDFYVDVKQTVFTPAGLCLAGAALYDLVRGVCGHCVGGLAIGAVPLVSAVLGAAQADPSYDLKGFFVRPAAKGHGLGRKLEGCFDPRQPVVIVEDVVTTGRSALVAIEAVRQAGGRTSHVIALVDRQEGGKATLDAAGCTLTSVFTRRDLTT